MSNVEKIDAYLSNEMTEANRQVFEESIKNDPVLKKEFEFQTEIVNAIKDARKLELKAMLDKIPVSGVSSSGITSVGKIISGIAVIGVLGLSIYLLQEDKPANDTREQQISMDREMDQSAGEEQEIIPQKNNAVVDENYQAPGTETDDAASNKSSASEKEDVNVNNEEVNVDQQSVPEPEEKLEPATETEKMERVVTKPEINKPEISSFGNQENEYDSLEAPGGNLLNKDYNGQARIDVEIEPSNKKFGFHYQFKNEKLVLYGNFDKGLYEILEINSDEGKLLFLYYKDNFYLLNRDQTKIASLEAISDLSLIEKLKKVRSEG